VSVSGAGVLVVAAAPARAGSVYAADASGPVAVECARTSARRLTRASEGNDIIGFAHSHTEQRVFAARRSRLPSHSAVARFAYQIRSVVCGQWSAYLT
jgi:hypothetical protein